MDLHTRLKMQQRLLREQEALARMAYDFLAQTEHQPGDDSSQMQNLLAAALEAQGIETLKAWIVYQGARHDTWWKKNFVSALIQELEALSAHGERLARELDPHDPDLRQALTMALIRQFIGYLRWWHKAQHPERERRTA